MMLSCLDSPSEQTRSQVESEDQGPLQAKRGRDCYFIIGCPIIHKLRTV